MTLQTHGEWPEPDELDVWTVDRILDGSLGPSETPPDYEPVASLLEVIRQGVVPAQSGWGSQTVPAMVQVLTAPSRHTRVSKSATHVRRVRRLAAAATIVAFVGTGTAAAATGSLPAPIQSAIHSAASSLGMVAPPAQAANPAIRHSQSRSDATRQLSLPRQAAPISGPAPARPVPPQGSTSSVAAVNSGTTESSTVNTNVPNSVPARSTDHPTTSPSPSPSPSPRLRRRHPPPHRRRSSAV